MLVATITTLLIVFGLGGGASYSVLDILGAAEDVIEDRVKDREVREEMIAVVKQMELDTHRFVREIRNARAGILALDLKHDSTREQYIMQFRRLDADWLEIEERLVSGILALKGKVDPAEWREIHEEIREELE